MIPVMVVDDEELLRSLIANSVDWESLGLEIVAEAGDSEEAIALADAHIPRIAIVDINIPFVDGLDLAESLRARHPGMVIIILTGYEEFSYARRAIKIGVLNYLLKPIDPDEFRSSLIAARETVLEEQQRYNGSSSLPESNPNERERFLRTIALRTEQLTDSEIHERFQHFEIALSPSALIVAVIEIRADEGSEERKHIDSLQQLFGEWLSPLELFWDDNGRLILLSNVQRDNEGRSAETVFRACKWVRGRFVAQHSVSCSIGIGPIASQLCDLQRARTQAELALSERFYTGQDSVYRYTTIEKTDGEVAVYRPPFDRNSLLLLLRSGNDEDVAGMISSLFDGLQARRPSRQYCELSVMEFVSVVVEFIEENAVGFADIFEEEADAISTVRKIATLPDMKRWLESFVEQAVARIRGNVKTRTQMIVLKAKHYIDANYTRYSLSLNNIADHISVTPGYISGVFKKQMGVSVVRYLTEVRIAHAKRLMDSDPLLSVGELADSVGYSDAYYFSKVFRKHAGVSPSTYVRHKRVAK